MMDLDVMPRTAPAAIAPVGLFDFLCGRWSARFAIACGECCNQFLALVSDPQGTINARCPCCGHINVAFQKPPAPKAPIIPLPARNASRDLLRAFRRLLEGDGDGSGGAAVAA